jgi:hypothetical protein
MCNVLLGQARDDQPHSHRITRPLAMSRPAYKFDGAACPLRADPAQQGVGRAVGRIDLSRDFADAAVAERGEHGCEQHRRQAAPPVCCRDADKAQPVTARVVPDTGKSRVRLVYIIDRDQVGGRIEMPVVEGVLAELGRVPPRSVGTR